MTYDITVTRWALLWRDAERKHIMFADCLPKLFTTRKAARAWAVAEYGYIRERPDLRRAPHGWRMPAAVRVRVSLAT